jgi:hypothetical protein
MKIKNKIKILKEKKTYDELGKAFHIITYCGERTEKPEILNGAYHEILLRNKALSSGF